MRPMPDYKDVESLTAVYLRHVACIESAGCFAEMRRIYRQRVDEGSLSHEEAKRALKALARQKVFVGTERRYECTLNLREWACEQSGRLEAVRAFLAHFNRFIKEVPAMDELCDRVCLDYRILRFVEFMIC